MSKNTNRSRAARRLQATSDLTYTQALAIVSGAAQEPDQGSPTPTATPRRLEARFVPQAWVNDYAIDVDPEGDTRWDVTDAFNELEAHYQARLLAEIAEHGEALDNDDALAGDPAAPEWIRNWSGPFSLWVSYTDNGPADSVGCPVCGTTTWEPRDRTECVCVNGHLWEIPDEDRACATCGEPIEDDPDGSPGVLVHARTLGDEAYDLDEDHPALDDTDYGI